MADSSTLVDRVKIFVESSGSGPFELGNAVPAFRGSEALTDGLTYSYAVESGSDYEAGQGVYVLAVNQLLRSPTISSNGGAPVAFPANVAIAFTALAADLTSSLAGTGTVRRVNASGGLTGLIFTGGPIEVEGTLTMGGVLLPESGGTGGSTPEEAREALGLGNVDNTSDADKPISTATQSALDEKADIAALASSTGGEMVALADNAKVQDAIMAAVSPIALAASSKALAEDSTIRTANGHIYKVLASDAVDYDLETAGGVKLSVVPVANSVPLSAFAADPSGVTGSADALVKAWNAAPEGGTFIIDGDYKIEKEVDLPDRDIDILCRGSLRVAPGSFTGIFIEKLPDFELPGTDLVAPVKGDAKLVWDTGKTPAATANEYYVTLESTEVLINRIGGGYAAYTKNEIHSIAADDWTLFDPILYDYTDLSKLTVRLYKKGRQRNWSSLRVVAEATGAPSSRTLLYLRGLSNIALPGVTIDAAAANGPGNGLVFHRCCHIDLDAPRIFGFNAPGFDSYRMLNSLSAHLTINRYVSESEPPASGTGITRCYVARHGNQVRFNDCVIVGGDDHFGSNYFIRGGSISRRGFGFAGRNFSARDVDVTNCPTAPFYLRSDTPYAEGTLELDDIRLSADSPLVDNRPLQTQSPDLLITDYKFYDNVKIGNIRVGKGNQPAGVNQYINLSGVPNRAWFTMHPTALIEIDGIQIDTQRQTIGQCTVRMGNFDFGRLRVSRFGPVDAATAYYGDVQWWTGTQPADMVFEIVDCPAITTYFFGTANGQKMIVRNSTIGGMGGASDNAMFNGAVTTTLELNGVMVNKTITVSGSGGGVTLDMVNARFLVQPKAAFNSSVTIVRGIGSGMDNSLGALPSAFPGKMLSYLDATVWKS